MIPFGLYLVGVAIAVFGVIGFVRGWNREIWLLGGLVLSWGLVLLAGRTIVALVNRVYLMIAFSFEGGFDPSASATALLSRLRDDPLISPSQPDGFFFVACALIVTASYALGSRIAPAPATFSSQLIGVPIGLVNGYLLVYALLRFAGPAFFGSALASTALAVGQYVIPTLLLGAAAVALLVLQRFRVLLAVSRAGGARRP